LWSLLHTLSKVSRYTSSPFGIQAPLVISGFSYLRVWLIYSKFTLKLRPLIMVFGIREFEITPSFLYFDTREKIIFTGKIYYSCCFQWLISYKWLINSQMVGSDFLHYTTQRIRGYEKLHLVIPDRRFQNGNLQWTFGSSSDRQCPTNWILQVTNANLRRESPTHPIAIPTLINRFTDIYVVSQNTI